MIDSFSLCSLIGFLAALTNAENVQISITGGAISGTTDNTLSSGKPYAAFKGIPYAEPPERFQLAKPKTSWNDVIDCTDEKDECVQHTNPVRGSENCLTLSVYTPNITGNYPVLVWVHGGYFTEGNASYVQQSPDFILDEDVVFVPIQYRLGVFGFLSTGDIVCPGNLGFKDQVLALKWVQENIKFFGGDPTQITLAGQSAGAVSVSLHLQSPKSKGLFRAAIMNSGTSVCLWGLHRRAKQTAYSLGARFGYIGTNSSKLLEVLKKQTYEDLQIASSIISTLVALENPFAGIFYGYVSEPDHNDAFFIGKSHQKLTQGDFIQVPILLGFNSNEAAFFEKTINSIVHGEDIFYLFFKGDNNVEEADSLMQKRFVKLWTNFVKFLNPTPQQDTLLQNQIWPTFGSSGTAGIYNYYNIDLNITTITDPFEKDINFYDSLYKQGGPIFDTY